MFKEGDIVTYRALTGKVMFFCEISMSILVGDEFPESNQTRVVVYNYDWHKVKLVSDSSGNDTKAKVQLMNRPQFPPEGSESCIVVSSSKNT